MTIQNKLNSFTLEQLKEWKYEIKELYPNCPIRSKILSQIIAKIDTIMG